jgi:RimJ/RimL family protein N-acetyltransferase
MDSALAERLVPFWTSFVNDSIDRLRRVTVEDAELLFSWRNDPGIRRAMFNSAPLTHAEHCAWMNAALASKDRRCAVFLRRGVAMGFVQLRLESSGIWSWGFYAAPGSPKGTGRALGCAGLAMAFGEVGARKVIARVRSDNLRSLRFHVALGFSEEGRHREEYVAESGETLDVIYFGVLAREWRTPSN